MADKGRRTEVTSEQLKAAIKKETKKAIKYRDEGETEKAAEHMQVLLKLKKALAKQEKKELKAAIKSETHLAVTHRDAGETDVATEHLKNVQKLKKKLAELEGGEEEAASSSGAAAQTPQEAKLAELKTELKAAAKAAQELQEAGKVEAAEELARMKEIQTQIKALKAERAAEHKGEP